MFTRERILAAALLPLPGPLAAQDATQSFHMWCIVQTETSGDDFTTLFATKDWASGEVKDYTTNHAFGKSRTSGKLAGWAVALQPNGSWTWNLADGEHRLDYRPTAGRQRINDGEPHLIGFSVDRELQEGRLYYDGRNVAVYCLKGIGDVTGEGIQQMSGSLEQVHYDERAATDAEFAEAWQAQPFDSPLPEAPKVPDRLRVLAWNIWHGGRRDGNEIGLDKTVEVIQKSKADIVCMQETYGSGAAIADALGFYFYLRSTNLSVMSRFPLGRSFDRYEPFRLGGIEVLLAKDRPIDVFSLWINHLPSIGEQMADANVSAQNLVAAEEKTRGREISGILTALGPHVEFAHARPLIVAGDYNSPSHLDWTEATASEHQGLTVPWPVSTRMTKAGFHDAFRMAHPDPAKAPGKTWSPRFTDSYQQRIDYVYYQGPRLEVVAAEMLDEHEKGWPSDHAAVLVTFELK